MISTPQHKAMRGFLTALAGQEQRRHPTWSWERCLTAARRRLSLTMTETVRSYGRGDFEPWRIATRHLDDRRDPETGRFQ